MSLPRSLLLGVSALVALCLVATPTLSAIAPADGSSAYVQMQMVEISKIDGVEQAFHADFYMLTSWVVDVAGSDYDPSKVPRVDLPNSDLLKDDLSKAFWMPQLEFINARANVDRLVDEPFSFALEEPFKSDTWSIQNLVPGFVLGPTQAWVIEDQRYQCDFTTPLKMQDFPFDSQYMEFLIESFWSSDQVSIVWAKPLQINELLPESMKGDNGIVGWTFKGSNFLNQVKNYDYNGRKYARLIVRTKLKRQPDYYMTKIVVGALLLVYMCIWVFALQVDEADRMMGTLQIFSGLITFLFVAGGDTPKVPYQTRLDLFMLWSFFNVALILFIHGTLYYWRECDVEDLLEERENEKNGGGDDKEKDGTASTKSDPAEIELGGMGSPSASAPVRVYVNEQPHTSQHHHHAHADKKQKHDASWRLRHHEWSEFSLSAWFNGLHLTRKWDAVCIPLLFICYSVGTAVILGRAVPDVDATELN